MNRTFQHVWMGIAILLLSLVLVGGLVLWLTAREMGISLGVLLRLLLFAIL